MSPSLIDPSTHLILKLKCKLLLLLKDTSNDDERGERERGERALTVKSEGKKVACDKVGAR